MWRLIANLYSRRIVNVNVNILAAGALALIPVLFIVKAYHALELDTRWLPAVTFIADVVCDVSIYFVLHFLANHVPWSKAPRSGPAPAKAAARGAAATMHVLADATVQHVPFFRDATKIQLQRAVLSPLLYGLWLGAQYFLVRYENWSPVQATAVGAALGIGTSRVLHTLWMLWEIHRAKQRHAGSLNHAAPSGTPVQPEPDSPAPPPRHGPAGAPGQPGPIQREGASA